MARKDKTAGTQTAGAQNAESCRLGKVGGQAVLEGVMMKCGDNVALSVRGDDGEIKTDVKKYVSWRKKYKILNIPILRGAVNMIEMFRLSFSTLEKSAEMLGIDEFEEETKFEKWLREKLGDNLMTVIMGIAMVLGVILAVVLFKFLPTLIATGINNLIPLGWFRNLVEGMVKIGIFVSYIYLVSFMPDIRRTFEYHGAEHKSIDCYESEMELTPENAAKCTRFHPRCGTSFIFVVLIISIAVFSFIPWGNFWLRMGLQLLCLPIIVGLSFEFIMYAGRHQNILTKILSAPGLWMQRITTREPSLDQLEVAIKSLKASMPEEFPEVAESAGSEAGTNAVEDTAETKTAGTETAGTETAEEKAESDDAEQN